MPLLLLQLFTTTTSTVNTTFTHISTMKSLILYAINKKEEKEIAIPFDIIKLCRYEKTLSHHQFAHHYKMTTIISCVSGQL